MSNEISAKFTKLFNLFCSSAALFHEQIVKFNITCLPVGRYLQLNVLNYPNSCGLRQKIILIC